MHRANDVIAFYQQARSKMIDLPVYHPSLDIWVSDMRSWQDGELGVIVTPWCMNVLWIPTIPDFTSSNSTGEKIMLALPSGQYEFIRAWQDSLGSYATCSLFSPMWEFEDQAAAIATAQEVMVALFNDTHLSVSERQMTHAAMQEAREIHQKAEAAISHERELATAGEDTQQAELADSSKRRFLRGRFSTISPEVSES